MILKEEFIESEIWILTFAGAFQRAGVYKNKGILEEVRTEFREFMKNQVREIVNNEYKIKVTEKNHIDNIIKISEISSRYGHILSGGRLNIGVVQKLFNLHLKYLWCLGRIAEPPHCPFDRIILNKIGLGVTYSWTKMTDISDYRKIIEVAKRKAAEMSLAIWELKEFARR